MASGGYRIGAGRPVGAKGKVKIAPTEKVKPGGKAEKLNPLEYMLNVMNDELADKNRRDKMAIACAPFIHSRKGEGLGKKDEASERAKTAGAGRFSASASPKLAVVKK